MGKNEFIYELFTQRRIDIENFNFLINECGLVCNLDGSLDGTNYDDTPIWEMQGDSGVDPQQLSFVVTGLAHFRLGFQQTGSTDSHDVRAYQQCWNYSST